MRKLAIAGLLISGTVQAADLGNETCALVYMEMPFGAASSKANEPSFGLKLTSGSTTPNALSPKTVNVDLRFNRQAFQSLSLNSVVLRQNQAPDSPSAAEINWWIVGGIAVGAAAIIHQENKKDKRQAQPCTVVLLGFPPTPTCI